MPDISGNTAHMFALGSRSACDVNPMLLLGGAILGGLAAALALLVWIYLRKKHAAVSPKSLRQ